MKITFTRKELMEQKDRLKYILEKLVIAGAPISIDPTKAEGFTMSAPLYRDADPTNSDLTYRWDD